MAISTEQRDGWRVEFSLGELTGALGDSITVLPIVVALGVLTELSLAHALLGFAAFQVVWGLRYGLPVSVEPMKALAGLAIAGALTYGELMGAGLLAGVVLVALGGTGALGRIERHVGRPVVRGVQFAVALLLAEAGLELAAGDLRLAALGLVVAVAVGVVAPRAAAIAVLGVGVVIAAVTGGVPAPALPALSVFPAGLPSVSFAALDGTIAQLAMTVGNAAVATSLLFSDLFDADVSSDRLARSMGAMNLAAVPFGALPMCHGSGGLAGKHAFGARTGGANVVLGVLYAGAALVAGLWVGFPMAMLGVLLLAVAAQLGRVAFESDDRLLVVGVGVLGLLVNVGAAFLLGIAAWELAERYRA